ncbi:MAG: hypothetical protein QOG54_289 [Actinomycetota bacterium]|jgi:hypothetical protein|nr:hypothetical protein [Actinomycetota bacterium]
MKKMMITALVIGLIAGAMLAPAEAKKKAKRTERSVEVTYQAPGIGATTPGPSAGVCPFADPTTQECIEIAPELGEKYIKVEIADATGQKVAGYISQGDVDGDGISDLYGDFCGGHEAPIKMASPGALVRISFYAGAKTDCAPSTPTTGTITVTFSNLP